MQKLHITYIQYMAEPVEEMTIFEAFMAGEASGERALSDMHT